jgi:outer membrane lipoprotein carrier protein
MDIQESKVTGRLEKIMFLALMVFAAVLLASVSAYAEPEDQITRIQKAYEGMKDISGSFVQKSRIKDLKRTDTYRGNFFIKPPKLKWEYTGERPQAIYVTRDQIMIYHKKENQVFSSKFDGATYGQAPIALLAGFGDIRKEFDVVSNSAEMLVLKPKHPMGSISRIEIKPAESGFPIKAITIIDNLSNSVDINLANVKMNTGLKDSLFNFKPPKSATVMEY